MQWHTDNYNSTFHLLCILETEPWGGDRREGKRRGGEEGEEGEREGEEGEREGGGGEGGEEEDRRGGGGWEGEEDGRGRRRMGGEEEVWRGGGGMNGIDSIPHTSLTAIC